MDDTTDPIANLVRGAQYLQDNIPEWFDKNYSVWVDSSNQVRRAEESNMSTKKISAGDTLTVGDLTDDYLGAVIEVSSSGGIIFRLRMERLVRGTIAASLSTGDGGVIEALTTRPVTVIAPPPVLQPDEPTTLGQCIHIEGSHGLWGVVADPGDSQPILSTDGEWTNWEDALMDAGSRQIIVSDPPRWPDDTPEVPERIEKGEWPDDDTHLREWEWIDRDGDTWRWYDGEGIRVGWNWNPDLMHLSSPIFGPWTRGERVK